jgi:hypothetical protein
MKYVNTLIVVAHLLLAVPLFAQDQPREAVGAQTVQEGKRTLKDRAQRGTLHDAFQAVRGDSGKWNDATQLRLAPAIARKSAGLTLDDWFDRLELIDFTPADNDDTWLLLRTRQLDDNDRVWVERVERRGNQLTIVASHAKWQGKYFKNFTYYDVFGVNLGKLEAGKYEAKWILQPLVFGKFEGDGRPQNNWPADERPAEAKPVELSSGFTVEAKSR